MGSKSASHRTKSAREMGGIVWPMASQPWDRSRRPTAQSQPVKRAVSCGPRRASRGIEVGGLRHTKSARETGAIVWPMASQPWDRSRRPTAQSQPVKRAVSCGPWRASHGIEVGGLRRTKSARETGGIVWPMASQPWVIAPPKMFPATSGNSSQKPAASVGRTGCRPSGASHRDLSIPSFPTAGSPWAK